MRLTVRFRQRREPENRGTKTTWGDEPSPWATSCRKSQVSRLSLDIHPSRSPHSLFLLLSWERVEGKPKFITIFEHVWRRLEEKSNECVLSSLCLIFSFRTSSLLNHSSWAFVSGHIGSRNVVIPPGTQQALSLLLHRSLNWKVH